MWREIAINRSVWCEFIAADATVESGNRQKKEERQRNTFINAEKESCVQGCFVLTKKKHFFFSSLIYFKFVKTLVPKNCCSKQDRKM